jgi:EAL and modified HD-GYP domain-containing signal transduction protein
MSTTSSNEKDSLTLSIVRYPIFDIKQRLWGYSLHCVGSQGPFCFGPFEADTLGANLAASAFIGLKQITEKGMKLMVDFTDKNILDHIPYALPSDLTAVSVSQDLYLKPEMHAILTQLHKDRYTIILNNFSAQHTYDQAYDLAHIFAVDARNTPAAMLSKVVEITHGRNIQVMAMHLENHLIFKEYQSLGFDYFHGSFFKTVDELTLRKLTVNEVARFNLLKLIEAAEPDIPHIIETLRSDAVLSFRLLAYLNSAAFGFRQKIKSIQQAVTLLGWHKLKNWLRVVLMGELNKSAYASALMFMAAQRGKFLETITIEHDYWGFDPDTLHLLGMFSLLDAMLQIPLADIIDQLPLEDKLKDALLGKPNNEYLPLLKLAQALEDITWEPVELIVNQLNLDMDRIIAIYQASLEWTISWLEFQESET